MIRLALAVFVLAVPVVAQEKPKPPEQQKTVKKLPPFPKDKAKWVIRGKANR